MSLSTRPAPAQHTDPAAIGPAARLVGGLAAGLLAGSRDVRHARLFALAQGRGATYPLHAVHGLT
ncbi:MAG TPA: hypothetical protein VF423_15145, partial [Actinomycetes bacterium]